MPSIKCRDIGFDCSFATSAKTEKGLMSGIGIHLDTVHNITTITPELKAKIEKAIKK